VGPRHPEQLAPEPLLKVEIDDNDADQVDQAKTLRVLMTHRSLRVVSGSWHLKRT
jgi:hypothetical protein